MQTPHGEFILQRLPHRKNELLRAWDAADEYLLDYLNRQELPANGSQILIINDSFGALTIALSQFAPCALSDSYLSQAATRINLTANGIDSDAIELIHSLDEPQGSFGLVLIKAPKSLALLEDELIRLRPHITAETQLIVAGMIKGLPSRVWKLLERVIGPTSTSLARKKARLIFATPDPELAIPSSPYPSCYTLEGTKYQICHHANLFSRESLDIGTRLFLQHIPLFAKAQNIIDLGCGNGVLGIIAAERNPEATIHFVDESHMAVASAQGNFIAAFGADHPATFRVDDGLSDFTANSADIILCNPPFHQQSTMGDHLAQRMFRDSKKVLKTGGELWIVGNRHLRYHQSLKKLFGNVTLIESNRKFVVLKAIKDQ